MKEWDPTIQIQRYGEFEDKLQKLDRISKLFKHKDVLSKLEKYDVDCLVIGGGVSGVAVARTLSTVFECG